MGQFKVHLPPVLNSDSNVALLMKDPVLNELIMPNERDIHT